LKLLQEKPARPENSGTETGDHDTTKYLAYRSRTHLWQRDPPYVLDTVFKRFVILLRSSGREGVI